MTRNQRRDLRNGLLFISPWIVGFCVFMVYPVASSLYFSFCDYSVLERPVWIGAENFTELAHDSVFWTSLGNTLYYAVIALPLGMMLAIGVALLLNTKVRGMAVYRTIFFLPSIVPVVAMAILWLWILNGRYGVLNYSLTLLGLPAKSLPAWLESKHWAMPALILMGLWGIGHAMVIYLAGLQDIPVHLYESAEIDGASWWQKTVHITLPMLSPTIYFNLIMGIIGTFQIFAAPYIMTNGGPERATHFYTFYLYNLAFEDLRMGYACAMAWILFLIILGLTLLATKVSAKHVHYER
ncbi:MAG TPA: sugar ABC transporter permease [Planctomycetota bacterium]|nr:sugar ABC transporter permease [Planctomycetota bacterium]HRR79614.1 sugar ABC transporter permease [Planctomycetota bacterium]HRT94688.1 sugar ABC transporter permease [Planctomycetota bacterium]